MVTVVWRYTCHWFWVQMLFQITKACNCANMHLQYALILPTNHDPQLKPVWTQFGSMIPFQFNLRNSFFFIRILSCKHFSFKDTTRFRCALKWISQANAISREAAEASFKQASRWSSVQVERYLDVVIFMWENAVSHKYVKPNKAVKVQCTSSDVGIFSLIEVPKMSRRSSAFIWMSDCSNKISSSRADAFIWKADAMFDACVQLLGNVEYWSWNWIGSELITEIDKSSLLEHAYYMFA